MGDEDGGDAQLALNGANLLAQRDADLGIQRRKRLIQQQQARLNGERARQRDALLLAP